MKVLRDENNKWKKERDDYYENDYTSVASIC